MFLDLPGQTPDKLHGFATWQHRVNRPVTSKEVLTVSCSKTSEAEATPKGNQDLFVLAHNLIYAIIRRSRYVEVEMPHRSIAAREFGIWLGVLAHPDRLRLVEELGDSERDVTDLAQALGLPHARTSSQLAALRSHRLVAERRDGRRVFYRLAQPELATWLLAGMRLMEHSPHVSEGVREVTRQARENWSHG